MSVTLLDLAALSVAIYEDKNDWKSISSVAGKWFKYQEKFYPDTLSVEFSDIILENKLKELKDPNAKKIAKKQISMDTGLRTALYVNRQEKKSVIAIRGTAIKGDLDIGTLISDFQYVFNNRSIMLDQINTFFHIVKNSSSITKECPIVAVTGHSLGGIMAKMLAPVSKLPTYAFNSPGVLQYLKDNKSGYPTHTTQEVITYCAQGDPIGNLRYDNDVGIPGKNYVFVPIGKKIPENSDRIDSPEYIKYAIKNRTDFHSMNMMYEYLLSSDGLKYSSRSIQ